MNHRFHRFHRFRYYNSVKLCALCGNNFFEFYNRTLIPKFLICAICVICGFLGFSPACYIDPVDRDYYKNDINILGGKRPSVPYLSVRKTAALEFEFHWSESDSEGKSEVNDPVRAYFLYLYPTEAVSDYFDKDRYAVWQCTDDKYAQRISDECGKGNPCVKFLPAECSRVLENRILNATYSNLKNVFFFAGLSAYDGYRESELSNLVKIIIE